MTLMAHWSMLTGVDPTGGALTVDARASGDGR
jgi:hypothetical protein